MKKLFLIACSLIPSLTWSQDIFVINKSFEPKIPLHYEAIVKDCKLVPPYVVGYWVMEEKNNQRKELDFLSNGFTPLFEEEMGGPRDEVVFTLKPLKKIEIPGSDKRFTVTLENCKPQASISLNGQIVKLVNVYAEVGFLFNINYVIVTAISPTGAQVKQKIVKE